MKKNPIISIMIEKRSRPDLCPDLYQIMVTRRDNKSGKRIDRFYTVGMRRWYLDIDLLYNPASYGIRPIISLGVYPCIIYIVKE